MLIEFTDYAGRSAWVKSEAVIAVEDGTTPTSGRKYARLYLGGHGVIVEGDVADVARRLNGDYTEIGDVVDQLRAIAGRMP
jgi:hypothetical protein